MDKLNRASDLYLPPAGGKEWLQKVMEEEKKVSAKSWCTDLIWMQILTCEGSDQSWERALSSLQSPKIIVWCGAWELTALAFMLTVSPP